MTIVVGSGVSGLTCAVALLERDPDCAVEVWTKASSVTQTTSSVAAAFWYPFRVTPSVRVAGWAKLAYRRFAELAQDERTGVSMRRAYDFWRQPAPRPWWADAVPELRVAAPSERPPGFSFGWVFDAPVIDTRIYLPWLERRFVELGGVLVHRELADLQPALDVADRVIHCAGLGARELASDADLVPLRGQLLDVENPGLHHVLLDEHDTHIAYAVPRGDHIVLGGTATAHDEDTGTRAADRKAITDACRRLMAELGSAAVLRERVGIRPGRREIRVELERREQGKRLVHNYGHGGAGITLSWGCASEVIDLLMESDVPE